MVKNTLGSQGPQRGERQAGGGMEELRHLLLSRERRELETLRTELREGEVTGLLGIVHHLDAQPQAAAEFYHQATQVLRNHDRVQPRALFLAWWGQLELEQRNLEQALHQEVRFRQRPCAARP